MGQRCRATCNAAYRTPGDLSNAKRVKPVSPERRRAGKEEENRLRTIQTVQRGLEEYNNSDESDTYSDRTTD